MDTPLTVLGTTERLCLRAPEPGDLGPILELWTDPDVTRHIGGPRDRSVVDDFRRYAADPRAFVRDEGERWWSVVERSSGDLVGLCSLIEEDLDGRREVEIGYFYRAAYWGRGYATEAARLAVAYAFRDLGLASVVAIVDPRNRASASVARKLGMRLEREVPRSDGVTRQVYRLCREAWEGAAARPSG